jgi:hypothetical protein
MESNNRYGEVPPLRSPFSLLTFQDPFASPEGGIENLSISTAPDRIHTLFNADSAISIQCSNSDRDIDSTAASSRTSVTSLISPVSQKSSPSKSLAFRDNDEDAIAPSVSRPSRDNDVVYPSLQLGLLDAAHSPESPASSRSSQSFDPNITPRPISRNRDSDRNTSLDGGADTFPRSHGKTPRLCK